MKTVKYSELIQGPKDILLCGIPVRLSLSHANSCIVLLKLSAIHEFHDSHSPDAEIHVGQTYTFQYHDKEEELRVGRHFNILDAA